MAWTAGPGLLLLFTVVAGGAVDSLSLGRRAFAAGDLHGAATHFAASPRSMEVLSLRGIVEMVRGDHVAAVKHLTAATAMVPSALDSTIYNNLAVSLNRIGKPLAALQLLQPLTTEQAPNMEALVNTGAFQMSQGRYPLALPPLERAVTLAPRNPTVRIYLAQALSGLGRMAEAIDALKRATQLAPDSAEAFYSLGTVLANEDPQAAVSVLDRALQLKPDDIRSRTNLGHTLQLQGNLQRAEQVYQSAVRAAPADYAAAAGLGGVLVATKRWGHAVRALRRAVNGWHERLAGSYNNLGVALQVFAAECCLLGK